jgi:hypothetical protein
MFNIYCGPGIAPPPNIFLCPSAALLSRLLSSKKPFKLVALPVSLPDRFALRNKPNSLDDAELSGSLWLALAYAEPRRRTIELMMARKMTSTRESAV